MNHIWIALGGIVFPFIMATLGAALVYCFKGDLSPRGKMVVFGVSAGVMLAASIWSLFQPAITESRNAWGDFASIPILGGFFLGVSLLVLVDCINRRKNSVGVVIFEKGRAQKLFLSMTLHNIPEGMAVGFAFGAVSATNGFSAYYTALGLAIGMGIQNFPESLAMALPLKDVLKSRNKAFFYTLLSSALEPMCAILGYFFAAYMKIAQPWLLSFAAGAMLYIVFDELLPQCMEDKTGWRTIVVLLGFVLMTLLELF